MLIFGEALVVFFFINVILERETRNAFVKELTHALKEQEEKILVSLKSATEVVSKQEEKLVSSLSGLTLLIEDQEAKLKIALEKASDALVSQTQDLTTTINNDFFKLILSERTSPEIANEMNEIDFFKPGFLFQKYKLKLKFSVLIDGRIELIQEDAFHVKNFSKVKLEYVMRFSTTETETKLYEFVEAGISENLIKPSFEPLSIDDFIETPIEDLKSGSLFELKPAIRQTVEPNGSLAAYMTLKTTFTPNNGGIDDYAFTNLYMMPSTIEVTVPNGYDFRLFPTFPNEELKKRSKRAYTTIYELPFLTPGQGYNFSLIKH